VTAAPVAALETNTAVTTSVVHATIEADVRAPVAGVPYIGTADPTPVARGPQQARLGSEHPRSRHPVIAIIAPGPVAWRPDVVRARRGRLHVHRKCRRSDIDGYANRDIGERRHGKRREHDCRCDAANEAIEHVNPLPEIAVTDCSAGAESGL